MLLLEIFILRMNWNENVNLGDKLMLEYFQYIMFQ